MNRGARRAPIFFDRESRLLFLRLLGQLPSRFGVQVHAFALMPNHFHLLVDSPGDLPRAMRFLCGRYVQILNQERGWDGPLFRGRYRNKLVGSNAYWWHLLLYLHLNPERAHLAGEEAGWTSHRYYLGDDPPPWLTTAELLEAHGGRGGYAASFAAMSAGEATPPREFDAERLWGPTETGPLETPRRRTRYTSWQALEDVVAVTGRPVERILTPRRGPSGNPARWLLVWWMRYRFIHNGEIGLLLRVRHSHVSRMVQRVESRLDSDPTLGRWVEELRRLPERSQLAMGTP